MKTLNIYGKNIESSNLDPGILLSDDNIEAIQHIEVNALRGSFDRVKILAEKKDDIIDILFEDGTEWIGSREDFIEIYGDAGFLKNRNEDARFKYDSGIRLNFIHNFLEVYFPLQSSNGFEPGFSDYATRIRFVLTLDFERVYNFIKRGFY